MNDALKLAVMALKLLDRFHHAETEGVYAQFESLRGCLGESALAALLEDAGFRIEGPGTEADGHLHDRWWWTLMRTSWAGIECGDRDFGSEAQALGDAVLALITDADLDWEARRVGDHVRGDFPDDFPARMGQVAGEFAGG